jgi:hypothetical protein
MGRGSGVKFDVTLNSSELALKTKGPEWIKRANLGVKIGKKKEFTDEVVVPIESVTMESSYSSATVKSYGGQRAIGYLLIEAQEINEALNEEIHRMKVHSRGAKIVDAYLEIHGLDSPVVYSKGYVRARLPSGGMIHAGKVDLTVHLTLAFANGRTTTDYASLDNVEGTLYFPDQYGYIPFEGWMSHEYDQITVRRAYDGIDDLWDEDVYDPGDDYTAALDEIDEDYRRGAITSDERRQLQAAVEKAPSEQAAWAILRQHRVGRS